MKSNYMYPNIEAERVRMGLSQNEMISRLGYKERRTYYNWLESGNIPVSVLMKMADLFDCSVDYLLGRTRNPVQAVEACTIPTQSIISQSQSY